jgi:hypothetical protein
LDSSFFLSIIIIIFIFKKPKKREARYSQNSDANCYICGRVVVKGRRRGRGEGESGGGG